MKKRYLFLTLIICALMLVFTGCTNKDNTPTVGIPVSEAKAKTEEMGSITLETKVTFDANIDTQEKHEIEVTLKSTENSLEVVAVVDTTSYQVFVTELTTENPLIIFNSKLIDESLQEQWISLSAQEIAELISSGTKPEPDPNVPAEPDFTEIINQIDPQLLLDVMGFFGEVRDEYFSADGEYYVFNETGKDTVKELIERCIAEIDRLFPDQGINNMYVSMQNEVNLSYDLRIKTGNKYIKEMNFEVELTPKDEEFQGQYISFKAQCEFKRIGTTTIEIPSEVMTFAEFMAQFEGPSIEEEPLA